MNVNCSATVVSAVMLLFYQSVSAEPAKTSIEEKGNIYQFANQCYLINSSESVSYLSKEDDGYAFLKMRILRLSSTCVLLPSVFTCFLIKTNST